MASGLHEAGMCLNLQCLAKPACQLMIIEVMVCHVRIVVEQQRL